MFADSIMARKDCTMDASPRKKRSQAKVPYGYRICVDPMPESPVGKISWFDCARWEFVEFKSYKEKADYAFEQLMIPEKWRSCLFKRFLDREWSDLDIDTVKICYYDLGMSIEETIGYL